MKNNIYKKICVDIRSNYTKLDNNNFILDKVCMYNYKCHLNSVQNVLTNKYNKVLLCMCIDNNKIPFVHFINQSDEGEYIDSSLGWFAKEYCEYYLIREINKNELIEVNNILLDTKKYFVNKYTNFITKLFFKDSDI